MKNLLFTLMIVITGSVVAQENFELTPSGFVSAETPDQSYLVLEVPGQDQETLYKNTLAYLHSIYTNPDVALSTIEGEMITVNGSAPESIRRNSMHVFDMDYTYTIRFKDGKARIDSPSFKLTTFTDKHQELHLVWTGWSLGGDDLGIYGKKDKLKSKKAKADLESFFNANVASLYAAVQGEQEDW